MIRKLLAYILFMTILTVLMFSFAEEETNNSDAVIIVSADNNYPPYEFVLDDEPVGFNIDLINAVAEVMNLNIEVRPGIWGDIRDDLVNGETDILSGMYYSERRDKEVDFSTTHIIVSHSIFIRSDSNISDLSEAKDKEILVQYGDLMHDYLIENNITDKIISVDDQEKAIVLLASGVGDLALLNKYQGYYFMEKNNITSVKAVGSDIIQQEYCFAVKEGNAELQALLNEGLGILKSTGKYNEIYEKWFGIYEEQVNRELFRNFILFIGVPLLSIVFVSLLWNWTMRREVAKKTKELLETNIELENSITRINQTQKQLIQNEKMAALGRMVAGITHEISTPLGVVQTAISSAEVQAKKVSDSLDENKLSKSHLTKYLANDQEILNIVMQNLMITINHLESFKEIAVDQMREKPRQLRIGTYLEEILLTLKPRLKKTKHKVDLSYVDDYIVFTYPGAISQIITNFITNSLKYGFQDIESGNIRISIQSDSNKITLIYADDGQGIPEENMDKIYEPFFTTGLDKGGSGIGLNIVYTLVTQTLKGKIKCKSSLEKGTTFTIVFPIDINQ